MTTFRPDTSFPYLAIARRLSIQYPVILQIADHIERGEHMREGHLVWESVARAVEAEKKRRAAVPRMLKTQIGFLR
jgi:hypothetical protein